MLTKIITVFENFVAPDTSFVFGNIELFDVSKKKPKVLFVNFVREYFDEQNASIYELEIFFGEVVNSGNSEKIIEVWKNYEILSKNLLKNFADSTDRDFVTAYKDFEMKPIAYWGEDNYTGYVIDAKIKMFTKFC